MMINQFSLFLFKLRNRHFLLIDLAIFTISPSLALALRILDGIESRFFDSLLIFTLLFVIVKVVIFFSFGLYRRYWRYASIDELATISIASFVVLLTESALFFLILRPLGLVDPGFPRSIPIIEPILVLTMVGGVRYSVRLAERFIQRRSGSLNAERVLIVGAGDAGIRILKEIQKYPSLGYYPVGFVDDDNLKQGTRIGGISVKGTRKEIPRLVKSNHVDKVIIAIPSASGSEIREIVAICETARIKAKIMPGLHGLLEGSIHVNQIRDVEIEDLLRRKPVQTDTKAVHELVVGKRVLVTGGGGSIGSELCRQLLRFEPTELILLGHGENSIFGIFHELRFLAERTNLHTQITPIIGDIRFSERVQQVFGEYRPQLVFHAAAHKHVPLMEINPAEAVTNNVLGTRYLLQAALDYDVEQFVMISTDKAVNPTSIMGCTKRSAELLVHQAAQKSGKPFVAVRFGNVLGSRGSVILTFKRQIANGGPVTVTDPEMRRFFMTIPEAVQLVLQAAVLGSGGEVFVLDMGEPVKIVDLAKDLIELSGLTVGQDIDINFIGRRPGEKLFEELFVAGESYQRTRHDKIFIAGNVSHLVPTNIDEQVDALGAAANRNDEQAIRRLLQNLVPEYQPPKSNVSIEKASIPLQPRSDLSEQTLATRSLS